MDRDRHDAGYSIVVTRAALAMRDAMSAELRAKLTEITDQLGLNPTAFEPYSQKENKNTYVYEHADPTLQITYQIDETREPKVITFIHFAALKIVVRRILFISYSHADRKWLEELRKFLTHLEDEDLSIWDDQRINAGDQWRIEIENALKDAKAAVLLISQDFLTSSFIKTEELPTILNKAKDKGLKIFWVPVRPSTLLVDNHPIAKFQAAIDDPQIALSVLRKPKREEQYINVRRKIGIALGLE